MFSTYDPSDVTLLLKDITGRVEPQPASVREALIQRGTHYCEMLPLEYRPSPLYMRTYERALALYKGRTAEAAAAVAEQIFREKGPNVALVSLARAGTSVGVLMKRWIRERHGAEVDHYSVSIIRGSRDTLTRVLTVSQNMLSRASASAPTPSSSACSVAISIYSLSTAVILIPAV